MKAIEQIFTGLEIDGLTVGEMVRTPKGLAWKCVMPCGHEQIILHAVLTYMRATCETCHPPAQILAKARGIETDAAFAEWNDRVRMRGPDASRQLRTDAQKGNSNSCQLD